MRRSGSSRLRSLTHLESRDPEAKRWAGLPGEGTNRTEWLNRHAALSGGASVAWNAKGCVRASAAYLILAAWLVAVVIYGVVEHATDPNTFHTVWLGGQWGESKR